MASIVGSSSNENTVVMLYTLVYIFFSACFIAPPTEFVSAGITLQSIFSRWLGSEDFNFVYYHIRRTTLTLIVHSFIPLFYYVGLGLFAPQLGLFNPYEASGLWLLYLFSSLFLVASSLMTAAFWHAKKNAYHPLVKQLTRLAGDGSSWRAVASSVNIEFRRIDKFTSGIPSRLVAVTDSWIIKTSTYTIDIAHQNDIHLTLDHAEEHPLSYQSQTAIQYLNIIVGRIGQGAKPFTIRLNSFELSDLKEKLQTPIRNARNIVIHQSLSDLFLQAFRQQVGRNRAFTPPEGMDIEQCIGCMQKHADVKLHLSCRNSSQVDNDESACVPCFCRPMWCLECMGKWFASRQDQSRPEVWMSSKSPCPTCRAKFCVLDVCPIQQ